MLRIKVELDRFGLGTDIRTLAVVEIANKGSGTKKRGNYRVKSLHRVTGKPVRTAIVDDWPRQSNPVLSLVRQALENMDY